MAATETPTKTSTPRRGRQHYMLVKVTKMTRVAARLAVRTWGTDIPEPVKPAMRDLIFALNDLTDPDASPRELVRRAYARRNQVQKAADVVFAAVRTQA